MTRHQSYTICNWKRYGIISDNYDELYKHHMSINNCQLCNIDISGKNQRCLDHDHETGIYRKTLCRSCNPKYFRETQKLKCNNKSRHMFISNAREKQRNGNYIYSWRFQRQYDGIKIRKRFKTLSQALAFSFINILKKPLS